MPNNFSKYILTRLRSLTSLQHEKLHSEATKCHISIVNSSSRLLKVLRKQSGKVSMKNSFSHRMTFSQDQIESSGDEKKSFHFFRLFFRRFSLILNTCDNNLSRNLSEIESLKCVLVKSGNSESENATFWQLHKNFFRFRFHYETTPPKFSHSRTTNDAHFLHLKNSVISAFVAKSSDLIMIFSSQCLDDNDSIVSI